MKSVFVILLICAMVNVAVASNAVIWQQELSCDSNLTCRPGALMVDKISNEVIVLGTSEHANTREADCWLWKIEPNGTVTNNKLLGLLSKYNMVMVRAVGIEATVKPDTGDIVRLKLDDVNSMSLSVTSRNMQSSAVKLNTSARKLSGTLMLHDMIMYQNDNLLLVGQDGKNGIVIKTDMGGNVIWEKSFDTGKIDNLNNLTHDLTGNNFYVAGISLSLASKMTLADPATVCVLRYDGNGRLKASDSFEGGLSPWLPTFPKVIYLPCGVVLVVYDKSKNGVTTELYAKAYTKELTPLWEKQILQTQEGGPPIHFDICATSEDRFVLVGQVNYWDLRVYEFGIDGTILQTMEFNGEVGAGGVHVGYMAGKIFVAFASKLKENEKEAKIKLLALKPYKTN